MSWRDTFSGYPYARPTPAMPFYAESIQSYLAGLQGFSPVGGIQQLGVPFSQSSGVLAGYSALGSYLPALGREVRGLIQPPSSVFLSASISPTSGLLPATGRGLSTSVPSSLYTGLRLDADSASSGQSRLPPPPPLKQAPRKKSDSSSLPRWHQVVTSTADITSAASTVDVGSATTSTSYSWHKPVMSSSSEAISTRRQSASKRTSPETGEMMDDEDIRLYRRVGDKFSCLQCSYTSSKAEKMRQHIRAHAGGKICRICGKAFVKQCDLTRHVHAHNKDFLHIWDPLSSDLLPPRLEPMTIPDEAAANIPTSFDNYTPMAVGSTASYDVPSTTEPSEAIFRVLRPLAAQLRQASSSVMPLLERRPVSPRDGDEDGRTAENDFAEMIVRQPETDEGCRGNATTTRTEDLGDSQNLDKKANITGTKSILQEILSDIVQNERKAVQDGYATNDRSEENGNRVIHQGINNNNNNNNNNRREYQPKSDPVAEGEAVASFYQSKPVTDTDILLALYGENLKKIPADNEHNTSTVKTKSADDQENAENTNAMAARCPDGKEAGAVGNSVADDNDEEDDEEDDGDDDDDNGDGDDDEDDDILCIVAQNQTDVDADESTVDSCFTEKAKASAAVADLSGSSGAEPDVSQNQIGEIRSMRSENNKQCDSSNETGQSSTDVDSVLDSAITLPEYASVGGSIVDLSMQESHSVDQSVEHGSFVPVALDPALVGLAGSPESVVARSGSQSPRLRGSSGYRCSICNYEGRSEKSLQKHIRAHSSSYKICRYCSKAFERPSDLARHEDRHERNMAKTGGDPSLISKGQILGIGTPEVAASQPRPPYQEYRCKRCHFVTNRYHKLALHKRQKHSAKHCCKYCPMFFISALPLSNHMKRCPMKPREVDGESTAGGRVSPSAAEVDVISPEAVVTAPDAISGIGRLDSFKKDVLFKSILVGVELGSDNELTLSIGEVGDDLMDHVAGDVPHCTDTNQAKALRASRLCTTDQVLKSGDVQTLTSKAVSPVKIDLTSSPPPPILDKAYDGPLMSSNTEYTSLANILSQETTKAVPGTSVQVSVGDHPVSSCNDTASSDTKTVTSCDPEDGTTAKIIDLQVKCTPEQLVQSQSHTTSNTAATLTDSRSSPTELLDLVLRSKPIIIATTTTGTTTTTTITTTTTGTQETTTSSAQHVTNDMNVNNSDSSDVAPKSLREILMADYSSSAASAMSPTSVIQTASKSASGTPPHNNNVNIPLTIQDVEGIQSAMSKYPILGEQLGKPAISRPMVVVKLGGVDADRVGGLLSVEPTVSEALRGQRDTNSPSTPRSSRAQATKPKALRHRMARYYCQRCNYGTDMKTKMEKHMKAHGGRFICKQCNKACIKASDLYRHWVTHNVKNDSGEFVCDTCDFSSPSKHVVMNHLRVHYLIKRTPFPESHNITRCGLCGKSFSRSQLFVHKRMVHGVGAKQSTTPARKTSKDSWRMEESEAEQVTEIQDAIQNKKPLLRCPACNKSFESQTRVNSHYEQSHMRENGASGGRGSQFECGHCSRSFSSKRQLVCHQRSHYSSARGRHNVRVHHQLSNNSHRKKYRCPYCSKRFRGRYYLAHHTKLHTGEKPYQCLRCGEKFALSQACQNHIKRGCPARRARHHVMITPDEENDTPKAGEEDVTITKTTSSPPTIEIIDD